MLISLNKTILLLFILLLTANLNAQHKPQYTQYFQNNYLLNPAITGIEQYADLKLGYRRQWHNIPGAPETYYASFHAPLKTKYEKRGRILNNNPNNSSSEHLFNKKGLMRFENHHGLGFILSSDKIGSISRYSGEGSYAYHQKLADNFYGSIGLSLGYVYQSLNVDKIQVIDRSDYVIFGNPKDQNFDVSAGLILYSNNFYFGGSICQLFHKENHNTPNVNEVYNNYNYFLSSAVRLNVTNKFALIPSVLAKYLQYAPQSVDLCLKARYNNDYWLALAYRNGYSLSMLFGLYVNNNIEFSYSFDYALKSYTYFGGGSSEFILGIKFGNKNKRKECSAYF